jgi:hypothetical protein
VADHNAIVLSAADCGAPVDSLGWRTAPASQREAFLREAGRVAVELLRGQLARGLDKDGRRMPPRKVRRLPDGARGPVLSPHQAASRAQKWIRVAVGRGHVTLYWSHGFGRIIGFQGDGLVKGAPARDVRGLSPRSMAELQAHMGRWWAARSARAVGRSAGPILIGKPVAARLRPRGR